MEIKENLYKQCVDYVNKRLQTVEEIIASNQKSLQSETKSSAGDKHETGRAMLQLEMEKYGKQLVEIRKMKEVLSKLSLVNNSTSKTACLGSIIYTSKAKYYLSISVGQLTVDSKVYFAVSVSSPIGSNLLGKKENDMFIFNGLPQTIQKII